MPRNWKSTAAKISILIAGNGFAPLTSAAVPASLKKTAECKKTSSPVKVLLVKQWHLGPEKDTSKATETDLREIPQYKNQSEIYTGISEWMEKGSVAIAVAEGCEGEMNEKFPQTFNGWNFEKLSKQSKTRRFESILTHVLLKAKVARKEKVKVLCGDSLAEIKAAQVALSDLRADIGYEQRLLENKDNPSRLKLYLDGVIEAYHLPATTDVDAAIAALKKDAGNSLKKFLDSNARRNEEVVKTIRTAGSKKPVLVVYGGLHAEDLKNKFEEQNWNCEIYQPMSYRDDEEKLIHDFKKIIE